MLWLYNLLMEANNAVVVGRRAGGEQKLLELLEANDSLVDGWVSARQALPPSGPNGRRRLSALREANARRPQDPFLVSKLANALISAQQPAGGRTTPAGSSSDNTPTIPSSFSPWPRVMECSGRFAEAESALSQGPDPRSALRSCPRPARRARSAPGRPRHRRQRSSTRPCGSIRGWPRRAFSRASFSSARTASKRLRRPTGTSSLIHPTASRRRSH